MGDVECYLGRRLCLYGRCRNELRFSSSTPHGVSLRNIISSTQTGLCYRSFAITTRLKDNHDEVPKTFRRAELSSLPHEHIVDSRNREIKGWSRIVRAGVTYVALCKADANSARGSKFDSNHATTYGGNNRAGNHGEPLYEASPTRRR